jgi:hypothetical protein
MISIGGVMALVVQLAQETTLAGSPGLLTP